MEEYDIIIVYVKQQAGLEHFCFMLYGKFIMVEEHQIQAETPGFACIYIHCKSIIKLEI
jgi:hypothetical protein